MIKNSDCKVLIVDDLPKNIMVLGNTLMTENYQIAYARSGQEAIDISLKNKFDLILLDIMMPGIDGYETCKRILSNPHTADIPIIFLTAKNDNESIVKGFEAGAKDYVTKPFNSRELLARVRTHLELKKNRERLENINEELEDKVKDRTEQLQKANEKIKHLDAAKSSFLGILSHELRTPLNGIFGSIEMLKDSLDAEELEILTIMQDSAERLLSFSELSSLISALNVDNYELSKKSINLKEMIGQISSELEKSKSEWSAFEIHFNNIDNHLTLEADEKLLRKVVYDIIHNSLKFNQENVEVKIDVSVEDEHISLKLEDNGVGFPEHIMARVFEVFHSDSEEYVDGKGLNLAAAKLIMKAHNGDIIACNSEIHGGAIVQLHFPLT